MFKKLRKNEKGFTLAELLIVVAIIGVLVAISIPIFTSQLEKSKEAVDLANIRAAYAECASDVLTGNGTDGYFAEVKTKQSKDGWASTPDKIAGTLDVTSDTTAKALATNKTIYVCVNASGELSLTTTKPTTGYKDVTTVNADAKKVGE